MIFELYGFRSVVGKSVWSLNFLLSALVLIVFFVAPVWRVMASTSLSCPMGYKDMVPPTSASVFPQKRCVRVIDYASQFILVKESLDYYYKVILPCEGQPDSFPTCGHLWPSKFKPYQQIPPPASKNPSTPPVASQPTFEEGGSSRPICNPMQKSGPGCSGGGGISGKSDSSSPVTTSPPATRAGQGEGASASDSASRNGTGRNSTAPKNADAEQSGKNSESNSSDDKAKEGASSVADNSEGSDNSEKSQEAETSGNNPSQGDAYSLPQGFPSLQEVESDREYCASSHKSANICCNDPVQCVTGLSGPSSSTVSAVGSLVMGAVGMMAMNGASGADGQAGIAKSCELMKLVSLGGAAANTALGAKCFSDKGTCEDRCQEVADKYRRVISECSQLETSRRNGGGSGPLCPSSWVIEYREAFASATTRIDRCTGFNANVAAMGSQAAQSVAASGFADLCAQAATAQATGFPNIDQQPVFNGDCNDPVNASNPICVKCRGPEAKYDPLCGGLGGGSNSGSLGSSSAFQDPDFGTRFSDGSDLNVPDGQDQSQDPIFEAGLGQQASAQDIPRNGGGFIGGSGGGAMPFSGGGGSYAGGAGYDTDIMNGLGGGGGYTVSSVPTDSPGGFSGAGTMANGQRSPNPFDKFELKKYLPGANGDLSRFPAGSGQSNRNPEIGGPEEDIFEKIHLRYRLMCAQGRLIGCEAKSGIRPKRSH